LDLPKCKSCNYLTNAPDGVCSLKMASDGLLLRCVGAWSKAKHYYLEKYVNTFTTSMRKKWDGELYYIDLFAGSGKCLARETEEEIDGSPLIALNARYPFAGYFFVDSNKEVLDVLSERCKSYPNFDKIKFWLGDCNSVIDDIIKDIPRRSLSLAFIDPTGLQFKFATLQKLAQRKVDLIITFPDGMAIKRNIKKFLDEPHSPLDDMVGDRQWRKFQTAKEIVGHYRSKLPSLGYQKVRLGDEVRIRSFSRKLPLYLLLFATKNPLGHKFWQDITKIDHTGQRRLL
jgi:three-Cys-motif partner protein